ncbi:LOW QUALITY PROTEIN: microtubule-associated protein 10 [Callorhinchus milii]|uniref:LOW QUALITY PROTEIN: microtubule-associated protein 10 n=1 Tax=Callorhinchus milii TaxID=7868 RepID=UPI001C3FDBEA|nr:LOW QUALITY PROTEIN: microtubule-associated protein 10 [Callorhinchus milii]
MDACSGGLSPTAPAESLFSLELVVDCVRVSGAPAPGVCAAPGPAAPPSRLLAVAFRLLDFPTVLVHQVEPESAEAIRRASAGEEEGTAPQQLRDGPGSCTFSKGKSCLFRINLASLHSHLTHTPLYAMLLDVSPHLPKLVGSCLISLGDTIEKIRQDAEKHGVAVPSAHGGKGGHTLYNLMGEKVGYITVGHRLLSLGTSLLPHIPEKDVLKVGVRNESVPPCTPRSVGYRCEVCGCIPAHSLKEPDSVHNCSVLVQQLELGDTEVPIVISELDENRRPGKLSTGTQTQHTIRRLSINLEIEQHRDFYDIADNVFCPPPLYYNQSAEEPEENYTQMYRTVEHQVECFPRENNSDEEDGLKTDHLFRMSQTLTHSSVPQDQMEKTSRIKSQVQSKQQQSDVGNTISQLPLLNALLLELSLLSDQALPQIPLTIHPQLAWLYRERKDDFPVVDQVAKSETPTQHPKSSTPISNNYTERHPKKRLSPKYVEKEKRPKQDNIEARIGLEHRKNKLMYGLTNTFRLRLQKTNPNFLILHEKKELLRKRQVEQLKGRPGIRCKSNIERSSSKPHQLDKGGGQISLQSTAFKNKGETLIQATVEQDSPNFSKLSRNVTFSDDNDSHIGKDVNVRLPKTFPHDAGHIQNEAYNEDVDIFQTQEGNHGFPTNTSPEDGGIETSYSYHSSPEPRYSEDFSIDLEPAEYSEEFASPEPTSKYEDTLGSSTETTGTGMKHTNSTTESESHMSERSNDSQKPASHNTEDLFPLPEPSEKSPILALKGTCIVKGRHRRPSLSSTLSDTSDDSIISSKQNRFKKQIKSTTPENYMIEDNPASTESPQFSNSRNRNRTLEEDHSVGTSQVSSYIPSNVSDFDLSAREMTPVDLKEDGDEPGTMGIANKCKHISELIANKLPGYTL